MKWSFFILPTILTTAMSSRISRPPRNHLTRNERSVLIQGKALRTWSYSIAEDVQVVLNTEHRPFDADIQLWQGPDNTPINVRAYSDNGWVRPFNAVFWSKYGPTTIAVRNTGQLEFPLVANVRNMDVSRPSSLCLESFADIQGGGCARTRSTRQFETFMSYFRPTADR